MFDEIHGGTWNVIVGIKIYILWLHIIKIKW
jgi:hypothetical protein